MMVGHVPLRDPTHHRAEAPPADMRHQHLFDLVNLREIASTGVFKTPPLTPIEDTKLSVSSP